MASRPQPSGADYEVSQSRKMSDKIREAPFIPIGIAGMIGALGWGAYSFKNRGSMSTSVFLMHLRVKAQGMIVGAITVGMAVSLLNEYYIKPAMEERAKHS